MKNIFIAYILILSSLISCSEMKENEQLTWLNIPQEVRFKAIEKQFRGFDVVMVEVGYRYNEVYWAAEDHNWDLVEYHIDKLELAINLGIEKRPKRSENAQMIFPILHDLKLDAQSNNYKAFKESFTNLRQTCNNCHNAEKVSFFNVDIPTHRLSPIKGKSVRE